MEEFIQLCKNKEIEKLKTLFETSNEKTKQFINQYWHGKTSLMYAVRSTSKFVDLKLFYLKVEKKNSLHWAAYKDSVDVAKILIEKNPDLLKVLDKNGNKPIHLAALSNSTEVGKLILDKETIMEANKSGFFPIHIAASRGNLQFLKMLLIYGESINQQTVSGKTSLLLACENEFQNVVSFLINIGADIHLSDNQGKSPFSICEKGCSPGITKLLMIKRELPPDDQKKDYYDENGLTILHNAIISKNIQKINDILKDQEQCTNLINLPTLKDSETPLILASRISNLIVVRKLIESGASINFKSESGNSALHEAMQQENIEIASFLLYSGANPNEKDKNGDAPIHICTNSNISTLLEIFSQIKADFNIQDSQNNTALHIAASKNNLKLISLLLSNGADPNIKGFEEDSPVHALVKGLWILNQKMMKKSIPTSHEIIQELINFGCDLNSKNNQGLRPLDFLIRNKMDSVVEMFLQFKEVSLEADHEGNSLFHLCILYNQNPDIFQMIEKAGLDIQKVDSKENGLLSTAVLSRKIQFIKYLISRECDTNNLNERGDNLLHVAVRGGDPETISFVLQLNAFEVNQKDKDGLAPIHIAAQNGFMNSCDVLLSHGADINILTNNGEGVAELAIQNVHKKTTAFLLSRGAKSPIHESILKNDSKAIIENIQKGFFGELKNHEGITVLHLALKCNIQDEEAMISIIDTCDTVDLLCKVSEWQNQAQNTKNNGDHKYPSLKEKIIRKENSLDPTENINSIEIEKEEEEMNIYNVVPIQIAARNGNIKICKHLLKKGATLLKYSKGQDPYIIARKYGHKECSQMLRKEFQRVTAAYEILTTERNYLGILYALINYVILPLRNENILSREDIVTIFLNIEQIYHKGLKLVESLTQNIKKWRYETGIGESVLKIPNVMKVYSLYVSNQDKAIKLLKTKLATNPPFEQFINKAIKHPDFGRLSVESIFLKPVLRVGQYPLLVKECLKRTPPNHPDYPQVSKAYEETAETSFMVNRTKHLQDNKEKLEELQSKFPHLQIKNMPDRMFVFEGELFMNKLSHAPERPDTGKFYCGIDNFYQAALKNSFISSKTSIFPTTNYIKLANINEKIYAPKHLILFNDIFLICQLYNQKYQVEYLFPTITLFVETEFTEEEKKDLLVRGVQTHTHRFKLITSYGTFIFSSNKENPVRLWEKYLKETIEKSSELFIEREQVTPSEFVRRESSIRLEPENTTSFGKLSKSKFLEQSTTNLVLEIQQKNQPDLITNYSESILANLAKPTEVYSCLCYVSLSGIVRKFNYLIANSSEENIQSKILEKLRIVLNFDQLEEKQTRIILLHLTEWRNSVKTQVKLF
ncbi:ankyrin repeat family protein [Anaeramoeba ignava]|uniref:Ankyrin repeat family protein n=1 Tax=Anaeramoeba ignava TaxID=1746090 RepID=A0A9Q0LXL2_ANAIG|nr:ankyrin repeat family protein [Anaeramoeba ignava]